MLQKILLLEVLIFSPAILTHVLCLILKGKNRKIRKTRNHYFEMGCFINIMAYRFVKNIIYKIFFKLFYGKYDKFDFDTFKEAIYNFSPEGFERVTANFYSELGYYTKLMPSGPDGGKDVILIKNFKKTYVECKLYRGSNEVGREICQKLVGAAVGDGVFSGIIFTCGEFYRNAHEYLDTLDQNNFDLRLVGLKEMYELYLTLRVQNEKLLLYRDHDFGVERPRKIIKFRGFK